MAKAVFMILNIETALAFVDCSMVMTVRQSLLDVFDSA